MQLLTCPIPNLPVTTTKTISLSFLMFMMLNVPLPSYSLKIQSFLPFHWSPSIDQSSDSCSSSKLSLFWNGSLTESALFYLYSVGSVRNIKTEDYVEQLQLLMRVLNTDSRNGCPVQRSKVDGCCRRNIRCDARRKNVVEGLRVCMKRYGSMSL